MHQRHQRLSKWITKIPQSSLDSTMVPRDTQKWLQKAPDPEKPEIRPKTAFPQEKINTGRRPVQKPIFPRFRIESQKGSKNWYCSPFSWFFGGKTYNCGVFIGCGNHNPAGFDTIQFVGHVNIKVLLKSTLSVEQHLVVVLCKLFICAALIVLGGTIHE